MSVQQISLVGDPDILLCMCGRFVALELKSAGNTARKIQEYKLNKVTRAGGVAILCSPDNWDEVKKQLTELSRSTSGKETQSSTENQVQDPE